MELPAELEAVIRAAPDDRAGYLVAADWLTSQGDPQGELIALSLAPASDDIAARIAQLQHQLAPAQTPGNFRSVKLDWRWGFLVGIRLGWPGWDDPEGLRSVLRSPVARFVRDFVLVALDNGSLVDVVAGESRTLASVRTLVIQSHHHISVRVVPVWQSMPALERLVLRIENDLGPLAVPQLRELSISGPLARYPRVAARLPALRRLSVAGAPGDLEAWRDFDVAEQMELFDVIVYDDDNRTERRFVVDRVGRRGVGERAALLAMRAFEGPPPGTLFELPDVEQLTIGRATGAGLLLDMPSVGRRHTRLVRTLGAGWIAADLGTTNGTRLNGHPIRDCPLRSGDELSLGQVDFRFLAGDVDTQAAELRARLGPSST